MNDWDKNNLAFILKCSPDGLKQFCLESEDDDILYALELIRTALDELCEERLTDNDLGEANQVLQKFRLAK